MAFQFKLGPLLRLRQSIERQQALHLREASLNVARAADALTRLNQYLAGSSEADLVNLRAGRTAVELHFATMSRENLQRLRHELEEELARLKEQRQKVAAEYHRAYREREALEILRDNHRQLYRQEELRRDQRILDESHLIQFWRRRNG